ncbi:MAG: hypothetical protein AAGJ18_11900 [Bacteroidota bacterium]
MFTKKLKIRKCLKAILTGCLTVFAFVAATAQESIFDVMNHKEVLSVTLEADFAALDSARRSAEEYKAVLTFEDETGTAQKWNVKLETRGNYRRLKCEMVPLKINFKKKDLKAAGLKKYDDMKLVTHCVSSKGEAKALLQKEYLAYKLYNEITEYSYRVQLLKINYVDVNSGKKTKHWAFLIEDTAELKDRIGATEKVEQYLNLPRDTFHDGLLKITSVYQYLIGNSDWDLQMGRNLKYFIKDDKVILIPYDFDFSGLVNASYAIPNPNYGIPTVKTRIFLGFPEDATKLKGTLSYFKTKREKLYEVVNAFRVLDESGREDVLFYLNGFYENLNDIVLAQKVPAAVDPADLSGNAK